MQIVIDIDKELYDSIQSKLNWNEDLQQKDIKTLLLAVDSGVIIPEGHGDLIDRDALEYEIASIEGYSELDYECVAREDIEEALVIIEADKEVI